MSPASLWAVQTLAGSALLMGLVLAVRRPVSQAFGARVAYALWLLPALRMVLPAVPDRWQVFAPLMAISPGAPAAAATGMMPLPPAHHPLLLHVMVPAGAAPQPAGWVHVAVGLWLAGAAGWLGVQLVRYVLFVRRGMAGASLLGREAGVDILIADVEGPVAAGILRRRIFLPRDFLARYSAAERRQALLHEGAHHDRLDLLANFVALGVVALHWWNPLAHLAHRAFRSDQELACDATVLDRADGEQRFHYGSALVKSAAGRAPVAACAMRRTDEVRQRLMMIKRGAASMPVRVAGITLAAVLTVAGLLATASGGEAAAPHLKAVTLMAPIPPVPPVPPMPEIRNDGSMERDMRDVAREAREAARQAREDSRQAAADAAQLQRDMAQVQADAWREAFEGSRTEAKTACAEQASDGGAGPADWSAYGACVKTAALAQALPALERARAQLAANAADLHKAEALARMDEAIARLRAEAGR